MKVNICGLKHKVIEAEDVFDSDACHMGMIDHKNLVIKINKDMPEECKKETICHEMMHGILLHIGHSELADNEQLVQALANAIYQGFSFNVYEDWCEEIEDEEE